ncbi:hypothetical protein CPS_0727 [Colwellia psychrerythraea 34H]|uniref:Uncharacterized protein n=1 Tax=Colwellia psychrerythraea (strain 34H / ATCC BAA-681) TaxID=167879 RepID=Q488N7_COLP3|nr:hypothetical protein CPS_0727 [Colwellia psychrerythraea 34H]
MCSSWRTTSLLIASKSSGSKVAIFISRVNMVYSLSISAQGCKLCPSYLFSKLNYQIRLTWTHKISGSILPDFYLYVHGKTG